MPEAVEELHLLLAVAADRIAFRQTVDQLGDAGAQLIREMRSRRPGEGVDLLDGGGGHRPKTLHQAQFAYCRWSAFRFACCLRRKAARSLALWCLAKYVFLAAAAWLCAYFSAAW